MSVPFHDGMKSYTLVSNSSEECLVTEIGNVCQGAFARVECLIINDCITPARP